MCVYHVYGVPLEVGPPRLTSIDIIIENTRGYRACKSPFPPPQRARLSGCKGYTVAWCLVVAVVS